MEGSRHAGDIRIDVSIDIESIYDHVLGPKTGANTHGTMMSTKKQGVDLHSASQSWRDGSRDRNIQTRYDPSAGSKARHTGNNTNNQR